MSLVEVFPWFRHGREGHRAAAARQKMDESLAASGLLISRNTALKEHVNANRTDTTNAFSTPPLPPPPGLRFVCVFCGSSVFL